MILTSGRSNAAAAAAGDLCPDGVGGCEPGRDGAAALLLGVLGAEAAAAEEGLGAATRTRDERGGGRWRLRCLGGKVRREFVGRRGGATATYEAAVSTSAAAWRCRRKADALSRLDEVCRILMPNARDQGLARALAALAASAAAAPSAAEAPAAWRPAAPEEASMAWRFRRCDCAARARLAVLRPGRAA